MAIDIGEKFLGTGGTGVGSLKDISGVGGLVTLFVRGAFILSGLTVLFLFIFAGVGMVAGAGGNDPKKAEQAKATATNALIGFVIVFTSYWIVKLIGQIIGIPDII